MTSVQKRKGGASAHKLPCKKRLWQHGSVGMVFQDRRLVMYAYVCVYIGLDRRVTHLMETLWQTIQCTDYSVHFCVTKGVGKRKNSYSSSKGESSDLERNAGESKDFSHVSNK